MVLAARRSPSAVAPPEAARAQADFRALYDAHFAFVWRTLLHFGVPSECAEDAAQEVFVTLHRRLDDYDPATPLRSWLWGMCRRVAHTARRGLARADRRASLAPPPSASLPPDAGLERKQAADFVASFLESLPEELREVFVMMEIEGMSATEAAAAIGAKTNTVYSRLRLSRAHFERAGARLRAREARAG
jgi:RNA polymerase sigma-70 factor (ECF subfamily)